MTSEFSAEWKRHQSGFTSEWRTSMYASKQVCPLSVPRDDLLRGKINGAGMESKECDAMLKDMHLIEAALAADKVIITLDSTAVGLFRRVAVRIGEVRPIIWVHPERKYEDVVRWLAAGADPTNEDFFPL